MAVAVTVYSFVIPYAIMDLVSYCTKVLPLLSEMQQVSRVPRNGCIINYSNSMEYYNT